MTIKAKSILKKIEDDKKRLERGTIALSINLSLYKTFQKACKAKGLPASVVAEKLFQEFIESAD